MDVFDFENICFDWQSFKGTLLSVHVGEENSFFSAIVLRVILGQDYVR